MFLLTTLSFLLIALLLMSLLAKTRSWFKARPPGKVIKTVPMGFWQRVRAQRSTLLALDMAVVFGITAGWLPLSLAGMIACFALVILCLPVKYTFTTEGVVVGDAVYRAWKEFSGFSKKPGQVVLQHPSRFGGLTLYVRSGELEGILKRIHPAVPES